MDDVIVIGGGAAGMMAAVAAAGRGLKVRLLEKNEKLGKKLYITGKGRCNVTNACALDGLIENQMRNEKFLYSSFRRFSNYELMELLENAGCRLKIERGDRVFPVSDHASDVTRALGGLLLARGAAIELFTEVKDIERSHRGGFLLKAEDLKGKKAKTYQAASVIVATGGRSYPSTGSTGDGYRFAESFGLGVKETYPSLVPFEIKEKDETAPMSGLTLKNISLRLISETDERLLYEGFGELLFTHFGVSGPLVLTASSYYAEELSRLISDEGGAETPVRSFRLSIDFKPALTEKTLSERLLRLISEGKSKTVRNAARSLLPKALIDPVLIRAGVDPKKKAGLITREERKALINILKSFELHIERSSGFSEAVITKGGVDVKELDPKTMEAKKANGLYFAGEVIDVDALTGGFNLQNAWSTGYAAGTSAGRG